MARVPIDILDARRGDPLDLTSIVVTLNRVQDSSVFDLLSAEKSTEISLYIEEDTDGGAFIDHLRERRALWKGYNPFVIAIFDTPINLNGVYNLFSVDLAAKGLALFTTHNVGSVLMPKEKLPAYIAFKFAFNALKFAGGDVPFHSEDRGCIFDYREVKTSIADTICSGKICDFCKRKILAVGKNISASQLSSIYTLFSQAAQMMKEVPMSDKAKPLIFIGSSVEGLPVARALQSGLEHDCDVELWDQSDVFGLGTSTLEALEAAVLKYDFAVFVFTPDDEIIKRKVTENVARDNVIFEAGLFIGRLGRFRTFIVKPRGVSIQIPTDLHGITVGDYEHGRQNLKAALGAACTKLRDAISRGAVKKSI